MISYSTTITIARPPSDVFDALLDGARYSAWTDMVDWRWTTPDALQVGSKGEFRMSGGPFKGPLRAEIIELEPERRVVFRVEHPALTWIATSNIEPTDGGSLLTYAGEIGFRGWRRLLEPFAAGEVRRGEASEAERLRVLLEQAPPETAPLPLAP